MNYCFIYCAAKNGNIGDLFSIQTKPTYTDLFRGNNCRFVFLTACVCMVNSKPCSVLTFFLYDGENPKFCPLEAFTYADLKIAILRREG